jgi:hypothetical protein
MSNRATQFKNFMVKPRTLTAVTTLSEADSGKTIFLNSTTEFAVTLPKVKAGLNFNFIVKAAPSGASYTIVSQTQNAMYGQIYTTDVNSGTDADFNIIAGQTLTFVDGVAVVGDSAKLISDGTYWYVKAFTSVYNGMTITLSSSRSVSQSPSTSPSSSTSASSSTSPSKSPSSSSSTSPSASSSVSPSASSSVSPSVSSSRSSSVSPSASSSVSLSRSPSISPSSS